MTTPAYRVEVEKSTVQMTNFVYDTKYFGRANHDGLSRFVKAINDSFLPGGVNFNTTDKIMPCIIKARLVRQENNEVMAEHNIHNLFEIIQC